MVDRPSERVAHPATDVVLLGAMQDVSHCRAGVRLFVTAPPYTRLLDAIPPLRQRVVPRGLIATVTASSDLAFVVAERVGRAMPSALLLVSTPVDLLVTSELLRTFETMGVSALIPNPAPDLSTVLAAARGVSVGAGDVGPRLRLMGCRVTLALEHAIDALVADPTVETVAAWAGRLNQSARSLERQCATQWQAPPPRRWLELARALHAVKILQGRREATIEAALFEAGFKRPDTGRQVLGRVCGACPVEIRDLYGWYWCLEHWRRVFWNDRKAASHGVTPATHPWAQR